MSEDKHMIGVAQSLNQEAKDQPEFDNPRDPFASPDRMPDVAQSVVMREALDKARSYIEYSLDTHGNDIAGNGMAALNALDQALSSTEPQSVAWRTDFKNAPSEAYEFFLVRPQGNHPGRGGIFHPTIVQRIDGKFYTSDNELDPIYFGQDEPDDSPMKTTLEWKPLPADWLTPSPLPRPK